MAFSESLQVGAGNLDPVGLVGAVAKRERPHLRKLIREQYNRRAMRVSHIARGFPLSDEKPCDLSLLLQRCS